MSQTFFSKQDPEEKSNRLAALASSNGSLTLWIKGSSEKVKLKAQSYDSHLQELVLDTKEFPFALNTQILCTFDLRGMTFFSQVTMAKAFSGHAALSIKGDLFKSERRASFRLLTYPIYEVWADFDLGEVYEGGKVVQIKNRTNQTDLFKNFLKLVEGQTNEDTSRLKIRVQDISVTGMSIHIGEIEARYFAKDFEFQKVNIRFPDETIQIPEVRVVYTVDYIGGDPKIKKFKVGLHFSNLPNSLDDRLSKKITGLLREIDFNKDFENFIK